MNHPVYNRCMVDYYQRKICEKTMINLKTDLLKQGNSGLNLTYER
jgi:hypothetical protein